MRGALTLVVVINASVAAPVAGQQRQAAHCATAMAEVRRGDVSADALDWLPVCGDVGAEGLAQVWERRAARSAAVQRALRYRSQEVRDARVYRAVVAAARDMARPAPERLDALMVLISHFDSSRVAEPEFLASTNRYPMLAGRSHPPSTMAWHRPLPASRIREVPLLLQELSARDPDAIVLSGALRLRRALAVSHASETPVDSGAITLTAGCATRVTLRSNADVFVRVTLEVVGTSVRREYHMSDASPERASSLLLSVPPGAVVATRNGVEVARLTDRSAPCAPWQTRGL